MIVIISAHADAHLDFVTRHLSSRDYVIIDTVDIAMGAPLTYQITESGVDIIFNQKKLTNVTGVWLRRPTHTDLLDLPTEERFHPYIRSSIQRHMIQLYTAFDNAMWVSRRYALDIANNKTFQLEQAVKIGFNVPKTIFTSDRVAAEAFTAEHRTLVAKTQAVTFPLKENGEMQAYFTTKISSDDIPDYGGLDLAPSIFQRAIDPAFELRVNVIGKKVFAAKIIHGGSETQDTIRDWRFGHIDGTLSITSYELSPEITSYCIAITKALQLNFGAIDLIQDKQGKIWFLEVNPNGQWAFIEEATGQPIGKELAGLLTGKINHTPNA